jgi:hypothetical protein
MTLEEIRVRHPMPWHTATSVDPRIPGPAQITVIDARSTIVPLLTLLEFTTLITQRIAAGPKSAATPTPEAA